MDDIVVSVSVAGVLELIEDVEVTIVSVEV